MERQSGFDGAVNANARPSRGVAGQGRLLHGSIHLRRRSIVTFLAYLTSGRSCSQILEPAIGDFMPSNMTAPTGHDPVRSINRALAALREAAEHLEEAAAAAGRSNLDVAAALSHVAASRAALRPQVVSADSGASEQKAA